jgi:DNA-directed RNA polymerase specialized sigma24 family protein
VAASAHPTHPAELPFEHWVAARAPTLTRLAYLLTGSAVEADLVVQDALASACLRWRRFAASPQLESLVRQLVVRAYMRRHGRRRRDGRGHRGHVHHHDDIAAASSGDAGAQPALPVLGSAQETSRESRLVWQRCGALSPRQRAALVLGCHEGFAAAEIATTVGGRPRAAAADVDAALAVVVPGVAGEDSRASHVERVRCAFQEYAETAPRAFAVAERARARARHRRGLRLAAAGAVAALVVPVGWALGTGGGTPAGQRPPAALGSGLSPAVLGGWRWESWGGVQVQVPRDWGHGDLTQWCVSAGPSGPAVDRPELSSAHALCSLQDNGRPTYTAGLLLRRVGEGPRLSRADVAPYDSARIRTVGGVTLTVVDTTPTVADAILASAEVVGRRDVNGCTPRRDRVRSALSANPSPDEAMPQARSVVAVSVCRYGLQGWPQPTLLSSRLLSGRPADRVVAALRAAPAKPPSSAPNGCRTPAQEFAVLELWAGHGTGAPDNVVVRYDGCRHHGINDGTTVRGLTAPVLKRILVPPWTGRLTADVPHQSGVQEARARR